MIWLASDCLLFRLPTGESIPVRPEMISTQLTDGTAGVIDSEIVSEAVAAVFHYFKAELGRQSVDAVEFSVALQKVLRGFGLTGLRIEQVESAPANVESDLRQLVQETGAGFELSFYSRLRAEMKKHLRQPALVVRFHGLRGCVKQLAGARRWSPRCQTLRDQIVAYLRACASSDTAGKDCTLIVE
jgi:hypothetical protein